MISVGAAFELGRVSQRSFESGPEFATHNNASTNSVSGPLEAHEVDRPPTSVLSQPPVDTPASLKAVRGGSVLMNVLVGTDGGIEAVRMLDETTDSDLNKAALGAIRHWRFNAGSHRGVPVSVWVPVRLDFSLAENRMRSVVTVIR